MTQLGLLTKQAASIVRRRREDDGHRTAQRPQRHGMGSMEWYIVDARRILLYKRTRPGRAPTGAQARWAVPHSRHVLFYFYSSLFPVFIPFRRQTCGCSQTRACFHPRSSSSARVPDAFLAAGRRRVAGR